LITTVLLDVDDTLLDFHEGAREAMKQGYTEAGLQYEDKMFDVFTQINDGLWRKIETKEITRDELYQIRWNLVFDALSINYDGEKFEEIFLRMLRTSSVPVPYALEIIKYLSSKYTVCVASNAPHDQQILRMDNVGLTPYIQHIFTSEKLGYEKPSTKFFDCCFAELGNVKRDEVIIIGDSITADIKGGIDYGIKTCWFNYRNKSDQGIKPHYIIETLKDLKNIL